MVSLFCNHLSFYSVPFGDFQTKIYSFLPRRNCSTCDRNGKTERESEKQRRTWGNLISKRERKRVRVYMCVWERESVCVRVSEWEIKKERVCVCERERESKGSWMKLHNREGSRKVKVSSFKSTLTTTSFFRLQKRKMKQLSWKRCSRCLPLDYSRIERKKDVFLTDMKWRETCISTQKKSKLMK